MILDSFRPHHRAEQTSAHAGEEAAASERERTAVTEA